MNNMLNIKYKIMNTIINNKHTINIKALTLISNYTINNNAVLTL